MSLSLSVRLLPKYTVFVFNYRNLCLDLGRPAVRSGEWPQELRRLG